MDITALLERFQLDDQARQALIIFAARFGLWIIFVVAAIGVGRLIPWVLRNIITRALPPKQGDIYLSIMGDLGRALSTATTLMLISASLNILRSYGGFYRLLSFSVDLAMTLSLAWLLSRISKQVIRLYGINLVKRISDEVNDIVLIFETIVDVMIGFLPSPSSPRPATLIFWLC
jgi:MscS family membrane protein